VPSFSEIEHLDGGWRGTTRTIEKMHKLVAQGKLDRTMHKLATWLRRSLHQNDYEGHRQALFNFLDRNGLFQRDPNQIERIEHPLAAMEPVVEARIKGLDGWYKPGTLFVGDCDLYVIMGGTIAGLWGFPYAFKTIKTDSRRPDEFSHVYLLVAFPDKGLVPFDATVDGSSAGWEPNIPKERYKIWPEPPIEGTGVRLSGMGEIGYDFTYLPYESNRVDNDDATRPVRFEDVFPQNGQAKPKTIKQKAREVVSEAVEGVRQRQVYAQDFFDPINKYRRGTAMLPMNTGGELVRATPELPAAAEGDLELPNLRYFERRAEALPTERIPMDDQMRLKPIYNALPKGFISTNEFMSPTFPFARAVDVVEIDETRPLPDAGSLEGMGMIGATTEVAATKATTSIWDSIGSLATGLLSSAPKLITDTIMGRMQENLLNAQRKVLDAQARAQAAGLTLAQLQQREADAAAAAAGGKPWYKNPVVIVGGAAAGAFAAWKLFFSRPRAHRR
jgi:hypothetical protein